MSKKTEAIEVRLSPEEKAKLAQRSQQAGTSMSALVRDMIAGDPERTAEFWPRPLHAVYAGVVLGILALIPSVDRSSPAQAAAAAARLPFVQLDTNGDGAIDPQEFAAFDGSALGPIEELLVVTISEQPLTPACLEFMMAPVTVPDTEVDLFDAVDTNTDRRIEQRELEQAMFDILSDDFAAFDINADGFLDRAELIARQSTFGSEMAEQDRAFAQACPEVSIETPHGQQAVALRETEIILVAMDKDADERVSLREYIRR